jgi:hypothetical protein
LRGPSQNTFGYPAVPKGRSKLGFDAAYIHDRAVSQNIVLFDYNILANGTPQNPSAVNDHIKKSSSSGIQGLLTPILDYATTDSGALNDPNRAIENGFHRRHVVSVFPQDGVNGYVYAMDELEGAAKTTNAQLVWHPYSDNITFNASNASNERYEWKIRQKTNTADQLYLTLFMPTLPINKQQFDGLFVDEGSKSSVSFTGKYLINSYALHANTKKKNVLTAFYPRKESQALPVMERITSTTQDGYSSQAAVFAFADGITDYVFESGNTNKSSVISSPAYDPAGASVMGKFAVYRKINKNLVFFFVANGKEFKSVATTYPPVGFKSDIDVNIAMRGNAGMITLPKEAKVTFYLTGTNASPTARVNGATVTPSSGGRGWIRISFPAGTHNLELTMN